jgi:hypothetical protein
MTVSDYAQVDEKQARAAQVRIDLESERRAKMQRSAERATKVTEWQVRPTRLNGTGRARQVFRHSDELSIMYDKRPSLVLWPSENWS